MVESMMAVQFDAPPGGTGSVDFTYPFNLSPDSPDAASGNEVQGRRNTPVSVQP